MLDELPHPTRQPGGLVHKAIARVIEPVIDGSTGACPATTLSEASLARRLDDLADTHEGCACWRSSLTALMRTLDLDATLAWQRRLATELRCPASVPPSAQQDWLLQTLLQRLRGG